MKYIKLAHDLNTEHHATLMKHKIHFRGNRHSLSLISLDAKTPEIGISGIRTERAAIQKMKDVVNGKHKFTKGRETREKELQAWLIYDALSNGHRLFFDRKLHLLTSELAITENGKRVVNDLLALDEEGNLVVVELKSSRDLKRIERQVDNFLNVIENNQKFFMELVSALTDRKWTGQATGMVVWNASFKQVRKIRKEWREVCYLEKVENGLRVIDYDEQGSIQFKQMI